MASNLYTHPIEDWGSTAGPEPDADHLLNEPLTNVPGSALLPLRPDCPPPALTNYSSEANDGFVVLGDLFPDVSVDVIYTSAQSAESLGSSQERARLGACIGGASLVGYGLERSRFQLYADGVRKGRSGNLETTDGEPYRRAYLDELLTMTTAHGHTPFTLDPAIDMLGKPAGRIEEVLAEMADYADLERVRSTSDVSLWAASFTHANTLQWYQVMRTGLAMYKHWSDNGIRLEKVALVVPAEHRDLTRKLGVCGLQNVAEICLVPEVTDSGNYHFGAAVMEHAYIPGEVIQGLISGDETT